MSAIVSALDGAQFTSAATAVDATVMLGYVPDAAIILRAVGGANGVPDVLIWVNSKKLDNWPAGATAGLDKALLLNGTDTGTNVNIDVVDDAVGEHAGGTVIAAANDQDHFNRDGTNPAVGTRSRAGLVIKAAAQSNSAKNIVIPIRLATPKK